jgi:hypothetical protein
MDNPLTWVPLYPSKLLGALSGMKPDEGYVYWIVCLRIYETNGPCKDTLEALARRAGMNRRRITAALDPLFRSGRLVREGDGIMNPFSASVLAEARALREERVRAGRAGGFRTAKKREEKQQTEPSKARAPLRLRRTHLQVQEQEQRREEDSRVPRGTLAEQERDLFKRGKEVLGHNAGGQIAKLLKSRENDVALARSVIELAATKQNPREYVAAAILRPISQGGHNGGKRSGSLLDAFDRIQGLIDSGEDYEMFNHPVRSLPSG